jgi:hypothetical protein
LSSSQPSKKSAIKIQPALFPPITDASREKRQLEKDFFGWAESLVRKSGDLNARLNDGRNGGIPMEVFEARVTEVYRLCYEQSQPQRDKVVRDFSAFFPHLIFDAKWLGELVRRSHHYGFGTDTIQGRLFRSMAKGLRSAASGIRYGRQTRAMKLQAAKTIRLRIHRELDAWNRTLQRDLDHPQEWINERAADKTRELVKENPRVKRFQGRLLILLQDGKLYDSSVLLAAKMFGARERELEKRQG